MLRVLVITAALVLPVACVHTATSATTRPDAAFTILLPPGDRFTSVGRHVVALSPDGSRVVYSANDTLYLRAVSGDETLPVRLLDGGNPTSPFFSPDGQWIGFWHNRQLAKVSTAGGAPITLCAAQNPRGVQWVDDESIVYGQGADGIWRVSANGGQPEQLVKMAPGEIAHAPQVLPGGGTILFTLSRTANLDSAQIVAYALDTGVRRVVIEHGSDARYVSTGHLVYAIEDTVMAVPFNVRTLAVTGAPVTLFGDVAHAEGTGTTQFAATSPGALIYIPGDAIVGEPIRTLVWVDRQGREEPVKAPNRRYSSLRLSPDGSRLAVEIAEGANDIWVLDLATGTLSQVTSGPGFEFPAIWTPDGRTLIFSSGPSGRLTRDARHLFRRAADGRGTTERLTNGSVRQLPYAVTSDGETLIFREHSVDPAADAGDLMMMSLTGTSAAQPLIQTRFREMNAELSPDGRWLVYQSNETGGDEIYAVPFPDVKHTKTRLSTSGGTRPLWARDGTEVFYESMGALMRVPIALGATLTAGPPVKMFEGPYLYGLLERMYDIAPGGQRFVMIKETREAAERPRMIVVSQLPLTAQ